jgi:hypothetical protein
MYWPAFGRYIQAVTLDPDGDHIAAPQLAADCPIEEGQITYAAFQL